MPELTSKHLVEAIDQELTERVAALEASPQLAILSDNIEHAPSMVYVGIKQRVAKKLGVVASALFINNADELRTRVRDYNADPDVHGIIVQLPLAERDYTDAVIDEIGEQKDVDGLRSDAVFAPATPLGILTLIEGYDIDYQNSAVAMVGKGRLVGAPLLKLMRQRGARKVSAYDIESTEDEVRSGLNNADIVISATGQPGLLTPDMFDELPSGKVFIDAGAAESGGVVVGDISDELREATLQGDCLITPKKGGIGPLTVRALLSNVVSAAEAFAE